MEYHPVSGYPIAFYKAQIVEINSLIRRLESKTRTTTLLRLVAFGLLAFTIYQAIATSKLLWLLVVAISSIFLFLIKYHLRLKKQLHFQRQLLVINQNELTYADGKWQHFYDGGEFLDPDHPFSNDIDLFGRNSLYQYLCRCGSAHSKKMLSSWLAQPLLNVQAIEQRQEAVEFLVENSAFRQNVFAASSLGSEQPFDIEAAVYWVNSTEKIKVSNWILILSYVLSACAVALLGLWIGDFIGLTTLFWFSILPLGLAGFYAKRVYREYQEADLHREAIVQIGEVLGYFETLNVRGELLNSLKQKIQQDGVMPTKAIAQLKQIVSDFDNRNNALAAILFNLFMAWDIRTLNKLYHWKVKFGPLLKSWLDSSSQLECLCSLATFNFNHPSSVKPIITAASGLNAIELGHPLIPVKECVTNDFSLQPLSHLVILTGANMAGKSTFVRTVALNMVLAQIGCNVMAKSYQSEVLQLFTSMRTTDNLEKHQSYFYTELNRLKALKAHVNQHVNHFVILDEMLKGTNSKDKAEGSKLFLKELIKQNVKGIVATHDLSVCALAEEYPNVVFNQSFEVEIDGSEIHFDYKLKSGICVNLNATFLMQQMDLIPKS